MKFGGKKTRAIRCLALDGDHHADYPTLTEAATVHDLTSEDIRRAIISGRPCAGWFFDYVALPPEGKKPLGRPKTCRKASDLRTPDRIQAARRNWNDGRKRRERFCDQPREKANPLESHPVRGDPVRPQRR